VIGLIVFDDSLDIYPFKLTLEEEKSYQGYLERHSDINNDGIIERIIFNIYGDFINVEIFNDNNDYINQIILDGNWVSRGDFFTSGDYNSDGSKELYAFTRVNDSIFLHNIYFNRNNSLNAESIFIDLAGNGNDHYDISISYLQLIDLDNNGDKEFFFYIFSGYSLTPRKLYIYNPESKEIITSDDIGVKHTQISFFDLDGDGRPEILTGSYSSENYDSLSTIGFGDNKAGTFIYNSNLEILYDPIIFKENKPSVQLFPLERGKDTLLIALVNEIRNMKNSKILFLNKSMDILHEISLPQMYTPGLYSFEEEGEIIYYISDEDSTFFLDHMKYKTIPVRIKGELVDISKGSKGIGAKYLLLSKPNNVSLVNSKLRQASNKIPIPPGFLTVEKIFDDNSGNMNYILYNDKLSKYYTLRFAYRNIYDYRYLIYSLALISIYLIIFLIGWEIRIRAGMRRLIEQKSNILELQLLHTQLQPHFTFNILNTLGSMIYNNNKEEAYSYLLKFSSLLRVVLETDIDWKWTLKDEISFVEQYLNLENGRFPGKYKYKFVIGEDVKRDLLVPKMIMQIFVENALTHGLRTKQSDCKVFVTISMSGSYLTINITDNGIGRERASSLKPHRAGKSIALINEFMKSYNRVNRNKFKLRISDLDPGSIETGTVVEIDIPIEFSEKKNG
jgi:hypothetical protein